MIRLHLNESPYPPSPKVIEAITKYSSLINLYHLEGIYDRLKERISEYTGLDTNHIEVVPGSNGFLSYMIQYLAIVKGSLITVKPTFETPLNLASKYGINVKVINLGGEFNLDINELIHQRPAEGDVIYIANPNNPTGNLLLTSDGDVRELLSTGAYVVVDEAYYEFSEVSFTHLIRDYSNLVLVRTLSKAFSLAGLRVGYVLGDPRAIKDLLTARILFDITVCP